ncbi:MAG: ABC transporter permease [Planctomycetota bacterium]
MLRYVLRRLAWMVPTLLGITLVVFAAARAAPGDAVVASSSAGDPGLDVEARREFFRAEQLYDQPFWKQYLHFLGPFDLSPRGHAVLGGTGEHPWHGLLALDFGTEFARPGVSVGGEIRERLLVTVPLALLSILLAYGIAVPIGVLSAVRRGSAAERTASFALFALHSVPGFWLGLMLVLLFGAAGLGWLPVVGLHDKDADLLPPLARFWDTAKHMILPVATLALPSLAYLSRHVKGALVEALESDFVRAARARGLPESAVVVRHALRSSLLPLVTLAGSILPALIGGSVVVETVFSLPGMGLYAYEGILSRDLNVILATTTLSAALTLGGILLADIAYAVVDPRIRHG